MANEFKLAEAFTEFTIKGWSLFKAQMLQARQLATAAAAPFRALGAAVRKVFSPTGLAIGAITGGAGVFGLLKLSAAAEETRNAFRVVFGDMADDAEAFVQTMAKTFRRNATNIRESLLKFQSFFVGLGATKKEATELAKTLQQLQMDFASFRNLAGDEAGERILSGLTGQMRTLIRFGINVQEGAVNAELQAQGFQKGAEAASRLAKALAATQIILQTAAKQGLIGDLARTMGSLTNQVRAMMDTFKTLGETLGDIIAPVFRELANSASAIGEVFIKLLQRGMPEILKFTETIGGIVKELAEDIRAIDLDRFFPDVLALIDKFGEAFKDVFLTIMKGGFDLLVLGGEEAGKALWKAVKEGAAANIKEQAAAVAKGLARAATEAKAALEGDPKDDRPFPLVRAVEPTALFAGEIIAAGFEDALGNLFGAPGGRALAALAKREAFRKHVVRPLPADEFGVPLKAAAAAAAARIKAADAKKALTGEDKAFKILERVANELIATKKALEGQGPRKREKTIIDAFGNILNPAAQLALAASKKTTDLGSQLVRTMLGRLAKQGKEEADRGLGAFAAVGFAELQKHTQQIISKGEAEQIKLLREANKQGVEAKAQRKNFIDKLEDFLQNPNPLVVGA